jgi:hypothetical protein
VDAKQVSSNAAKIPRRFLVVSLVLSPVFSHADSLVNLRCDVNSTYTCTNGDTEKKVGVALVEIESIGPHVSISISSDIDVVDNVGVWSKI